MCCGIVAGLGWTVIHRYGQTLVSVETAVNKPNHSMPFITTICHSLLQILTIALGSPLGRETAPREISAAFAAKLIALWHVDAHQGRLLLSCAAGAGLAAVYNIPVASVVFTLETLIRDWSFRSISAALLACGTATCVVRLGIGDSLQYSLPQADFNETFIIWAAIVGPIIAISVILFEKSLKIFPLAYQNSSKTIFIALLAFTAIGFMSMWYPEILGNGKAGNQLSFTYSINWQYGVGLFGAKWLAVILALMAGAYGGRITPSMMLGGMLGLILAILWNEFFPLVAPGMAAFVCAATYLGLAQKMPLTAAILLLEMSRFSPDYLFPISVCLATSLPMFMYLQEKYEI
jgi:H+/Cl- antiporter ClcA